MNQDKTVMLFLIIWIFLSYQKKIVSQWTDFISIKKNISVTKDSVERAERVAKVFAWRGVITIVGGGLRRVG